MKAEEGADRRKNRIRIDKSAFENCENLRKVSFDQGAKLESRAFYNCPKLWEYTGVSYYDSFDTEIEQDSFDADTKVIFRAGDMEFRRLLRLLQTRTGYLWKLRIMIIMF